MTNMKHFKLVSSRRTVNVETFLLTLLTTLSISILLQIEPVQAMWFFQEPNTNQTLVDQALLQLAQQQQSQIAQQEPQQPEVIGTEQLAQTNPNSYSGYGSGLLSMAGIQPTAIVNLLNTVGDTGFRYFNIQDQCRNRAACDLGYMLYKKLSFVHNWLIRASVRSLTDINNSYTQSWMEGMLGRNCTTVFMSCRQSPLEGLMNLAVLQQQLGGA